MSHPVKWSSWWAWQRHRLGLRLFVMGNAVLAAAFWLGMRATWILLHHAGLAWIAWAILMTWFVIALPALLIQVQALADLASYLLTGRVHFFPLNRARANDAGAEGEASPLSERTIRRIAAVVWAFGVCSPISAFATWTYIVVMRLPASARARAAVPTTFRAERIRIINLERRFDALALEEMITRITPSRMALN